MMIYTIEAPLVDEGGEEIVSVPRCVTITAGLLTEALCDAMKPRPGAAAFKTGCADDHISMEVWVKESDLGGRVQAFPHATFVIRGLTQAIEGILKGFLNENWSAEGGLAALDQP